MQAILLKKLKNVRLKNDVKISVVTVCFNSENTIEDTVLSVQSQRYSNIEYIVIDGKSSDATLSILEKYKSCIDLLISEPDNGLYDAINKGIKKASGHVVGILNSDDVFSDPHVLEKVAQAFQQEVDVVYGNLEYKDQNLKKTIRVWQSKPYEQGLFLEGWMPAHPTFYAKTHLFDRLGYYNTEFKISADYELMLRFLHKHKLTSKFIDHTLVSMRTGGVSNSSLKNRYLANQEDRKAWALNGIKPNKMTLIKKPLSKLKQFFT